MEPGSLCPTCLSQGRKMFPFPLDNTKLPFSTFYKDLKLSTSDMICWECRSFILKMAAFRYKALMAQANLAVFQRKPWIVVQSLSKLAISKGIHLDIIDDSKPQLDPLFMDGIKAETNMDSEHNECEENCDNIEIGDVKIETDGVNEVRDENEEVIFEVYQHQTLVAPEANNLVAPEANNLVAPEANNLVAPEANNLVAPEANNLVAPEANNLVAPEANNLVAPEANNLVAPEANNLVAPESSSLNVPVDVNKENIANATLLSLLTRNKPQQFPPLPTEPSTPKHTPDATNTEIHTHEQPETSGRQTVNPFTEQRLTEEEMKRWWARKRFNRFYITSIPVYRCEKCIEPFTSRRSYLGHLKMHTESYGELSCDICQLRFTTESARATHRDNHYRLLKCGYCDLKWDSPNSMRRHCYAAHGCTVDEWTCFVCPKQLPDLDRYLNHLKSHATEPCPVCGKRINTRTKKIHLSTHEASSTRKYECAECGRMFRTKALVKSHIINVHNTKEEDIRAFCVDCQKQFRTMTSYNNHMKYSSKHVAEELLRYKCEECPKVFSVRGELRRHVEYKHSQQANYPCDVCSMRFRHARARRHHRLTVHVGYVALKDKMCDHCGKLFQTKTTLLAHVNTHTGARPFVCKLCGADFGHKSALYLHGRYKHKIQKVKKDVQKYKEK